MTEDKKYSRQTMSLPEFLETERLDLRQVRAGDCDLFWTMESNPKVQKYFPNIATDHKTFNLKFQTEFNAGIKYKFFYILSDKISGTRLGAAVLRPTEEGDWVEVGYKLIPSAWGKGLATEITQRLIDYGFKEWGIGDIMALVHPKNIGSINI
jgi:ribosomal-protein-alanine N-acetyltransferase